MPQALMRGEGEPPNRAVLGSSPEGLMHLGKRADRRGKPST